MVVRRKIRGRWFRYISCTSQLMDTRDDVHLLWCVRSRPKLSEISILEKTYDQNATGKILVKYV